MNNTSGNKNQNCHKSLSNKKISRNRRTSSKSPKKGANSKSRKNSLKESTAPEVREQPNIVKINARVSKLLSKLNRETPSDKLNQDEVKINVEKHSESNVLPIGTVENYTSIF